MIFDTASITTRRKIAPSTVPGTVPTPPEREQPPTTAAAIEELADLVEDFQEIQTTYITTCVVASQSPLVASEPPEAAEYRIFGYLDVDSHLHLLAVRLVPFIVLREDRSVDSPSRRGDEVAAWSLSILPHRLALNDRQMRP